MRIDEILILEDTIEDLLSALRYIRQHHGELYGVNFDRCESKTKEALVITQLGIDLVDDLRNERDALKLELDSMS